MIRKDSYHIILQTMTSYYLNCKNDIESINGNNFIDNKNMNRNVNTSDEKARELSYTLLEIISESLQAYHEIPHTGAEQGHLLKF